MATNTGITKFLKIENLPDAMYHESSQDIGDVLASTGQLTDFDYEDTTAVLTVVGDGDYIYVWATTDNRPFEENTYFELIYSARIYRKHVEKSQK